MIAFRLHPQAERELERAAIWYERKRPGLGAAFLRQYRETLKQAQLMPHSDALVADVNAQSFVLRRFRALSARSVVAVLESELYVIAVPHQHRKPGYWMTRVAKTLG